MPKRPILASAQRESVQTILIVDDEHGVIEAVRESLRHLGCALITTTDPHYALSIIRGHQPLALLITDLFMPSMDGARLLKETRRIRPSLRAILLSGIASQEEISKWRRRGEHIVGKPWLEDEFRTIVANVLAETLGLPGESHAAN
jgi:CheY-like chemotaxis protein